jgi:uncharacterized membrane protein YgdD (TMEM256/DUF423 family)
MDIKQKMVFTGSLLMFLAIILGAMASHYLERIISLESILNFEVGVRYMVYHALALLVFSEKEFYLDQSKRIVFRMFTYGTLLFSGSIFLLSFKALFPFSISWLGPITPIGGGLLILGWGLSSWSFFKKL